MHFVVARRELYEKYLSIASSLNEAFDKSKNAVLARMKRLGGLKYVMVWLSELLDDIEKCLWGGSVAVWCGAESEDVGALV